jgi:hypothetical protein
MCIWIGFGGKDMLVHQFIICLYELSINYIEYAMFLGFILALTISRLSESGLVT